MLTMLSLCLLARVETGADILITQSFAVLKDKRVGLVCNQTSRASDGTHLLDAALAAEVDVTAIFSPEHGFWGARDEHVGDATEPESKIPIFSLYGSSRRPTPSQLAAIDVLVFDVQDIGTRFYTYISTLGLCIEACSQAQIPVMVLDRPNPLGGLLIDGPVQDEQREGAFVSFSPMPLIHGMTVGELALYMARRLDRPAEVEVIRMRGWTRDMVWDQCGLPWVNPSPNMRSFVEIMLYPAVAPLESVEGVSVGRGTDRPFEVMGAPFINAGAIVGAWRPDPIGGIRVSKHRFDVQVGPYPQAGRSVDGLRLDIGDREAYDPLAAAMVLIRTVARDADSAEFRKSVLRLWGHESSLEAILADRSFDAIRRDWQREDRYQDFIQARRHALLYGN